MDISQITFVLSSVTAIAAIVCPVISTIIQVKSNERTKRFLSFSPRLYDSLRRLTEAYANYPRKAFIPCPDRTSEEEILFSSHSSYCALSSACFEIMSLVPSANLHRQIISLLSYMVQSAYATEESDQMFNDLSLYLSTCISSGVLPNKRLRHKVKVSQRK